MLTEQDKIKLQAKVLSEYGRADMHTKSWKEKAKQDRKKLLPFPENNKKVKIRKILNNLTIRLAVFLWDEIAITNIPESWVLGQDKASKTDKVFQFNYHSMSIRNKYRSVLIDDAMTGVWVLAVDGWNDHKQEPIVSYVDSLLTYPDPKNWQDNNMSFFGTKVRKSWYELMEDEAYDQESLKMCKAYVDTDQKEAQRVNDDIKGFNEDISWDENHTDLYNHLTIFKAEWDDKPCVYLTTWGNWQSILVRCVKIRPLTDGELADPSTVDFGVKLFRSKPLPWSYAGISLVDDVGQYQDLETLLTNLQIRQAQYAGLGGRTFINTELGIDIDDIATKTWPWDIIPFTSTNPQINAQNGIIEEQIRPQNPIVQNTIGYLQQLSQEADPSWNPMSQGVSQSGNQTKAEIQTLQQNINNTLSYMSSNYMEWLKSLWESIYRSYARNMSSQRKKNIVLTKENGKTDAYWFKKNEFISEWDIYITVKSKVQEDIRQQRNFSRLLAIYGSLPQTPQIQRKLVELSGVYGLEPEDVIPLTPDERKAYDNLELLNQNIELKTKPQLGEDHNVYINIYKQGLDTDANRKAIEQREDAIMAEPTPQEQPEQESWVAQQLWASMLATDTANQMPSLQSITE